MFVVFIANDDASVLESKFKTEFLTVLAKHYKALTRRELAIEFRDMYVTSFSFSLTRLCSEKNTHSHFFLGGTAAAAPPLFRPKEWYILTVYKLDIHCG